MKTSDVPSNRPVQQSNTNQSPRTDKKPQKEFDKVLDDSKGKLGGTLKKGEKPFSPLTSKASYGKKSAADDKETLRGEAKGEKEGTRGTVEREYSRIEGKGKKHHDDEDSLGKEPSKDNSAVDAAKIQANQQVQLQNQSKIDATAAAQTTHRPGLNINEIQSIVRRCELAHNDKGKPEFRFELETKNLGNINLKVSTENERVRIEFATEDVHAQEVLKENLKELGEMLQQKGLNLVETKFGPRNNQEDNEKQQQQREKQEDGGEDYSPVDGPRRKFSL